MPEIRRPVFMSGENPGMTLYAPGTERILAVASYWRCLVSPWGPGNALVLWLDEEPVAGRAFSRAGIFSDHLPLARGLVETLTRYFPEFDGIPLTQLDYVEAACAQTFNGNRYHVSCQTPQAHMELVWDNILDCKQVVWPKFPTGSSAYDLTTLICPCGVGQILLDGAAVQGEVQLGQNREGMPSSSAFLGLSETWIGPVPA